MAVEWDGYEYTECRDYGHAWKLVGVTAEGRRYIRHLKCIRCTTVRKDRIKYTGDRSGSYDYPSAYALAPVTPADRRRLRLQNVRRASRKR